MKFENTKVYNLARAVYSARNPLESWGKSDSDLEKDILGQNDLRLAQSLIRAGSEHRKFMRQIFVTVDITAPLYLFKELETYKVGTVSNSTSTMHKLASTPITRRCFEIDEDSDELSVYGTEEFLGEAWESLIEHMERLRQIYLMSKNKRYWRALIQMLPESWLQKRTITMNYENVLNMYRQRCEHPHKLKEWSVDFKSWCESLPYAKELFIEPFTNKNEGVKDA